MWTVPSWEQSPLKTTGMSASTSASTRIQGARSAFEKRDGLLSKTVHTTTVPPTAEPGHGAADGALLACAKSGAVDGIVTTVVLLAALLVADVPAALGSRLLLGGCAGLAASASLRAYTRLAAEQELWTRERRREAWELANYPEGEIKEMVQLWGERGMEAQDAATAVAALARSSEFFVDLMMREELGLVRPDPAGAAPQALALGASFLVGVALVLASAWGVRAADVSADSVARWGGDSAQDLSWRAAAAGAAVLLVGLGALGIPPTGGPRAAVATALLAGLTAAIVAARA